MMQVSLPAATVKPLLTFRVRPVQRRLHKIQLPAHRVEIQHEGGVTVLDVAEGQTILEAAFDKGVDLPHDCKMGVCMTCPAKLVDGRVDQSAGMLSEEVQEKGYALMCVAIPQTDCVIATIEEEELLDQVMQH